MHVKGNFPVGELLFVYAKVAIAETFVASVNQVVTKSLYVYVQFLMSFNISDTLSQCVNDERSPG